MFAAEIIYLKDIKTIEEVVNQWNNRQKELLVVLNRKNGIASVNIENHLTPQEQNRAEKFKFERDSLNFILGRGCLKLFLGHMLKVDPIDIKFSFNPYGKPNLDNSPGLSFNISHAEDVIVLGFSSRQLIGVDVEKVRPFKDLLKIAANYFSASELEYLSGLPQEVQPKAFYRCWTRKESFIKAVGDGLSFPLDQFSVTLDDDLKANLVETSWNLNEKKHWRLASFIPDPEYIAAYATRDI